jgi:hypothetical protein
VPNMVPMTGEEFAGWLAFIIRSSHSGRPTAVGDVQRTARSGSYEFTVADEVSRKRALVTVKVLPWEEKA